MQTLARWVILGVLAMTPVLSEAKWLEAGTRHFLIYSEDKPEELRAFAEKLERFDQAMRYLNRLPDQDPGKANRLTVFVVNSTRLVQRLAKDETASITGFYVPRASGSVAVIPRSRVDGNDPEEVLFHEYTHHFVGSNYSVAWPLWLTEGFAEFHATSRINKDGSVDIGLPNLKRAATLTDIFQIPMTNLVSLPVDARTTETLQLYARGWLLVHYLNFEPSRQGQFGSYLRALEGGKSSSEAATTTFGDLGKLDSDLDAYVKRRRLSFVKVDAGAIKLGEIAVRELPPSEQAIMPLRIRSDVGVNRKLAEELVVEMRKAAAPFPTDAAVQVALAESEFDAGNYTEAEAAADRALAADAKSIEAHIYKGRAQMRRLLQTEERDSKLWANVRTWFGKANRIDPEDPEPLVLFYLSFPASGETPTANAVAGLDYTLQLAPQDRTLRLLGAAQSLIDGKTEQARNLAARVAADPHAAGPQAERAAKIVQAIDKGEPVSSMEALIKATALSW